MARHAKSLGYQAIAFVIDEFILWAQRLRVEEYAAAVNALNALVESADVIISLYVSSRSPQSNAVS